MPDPTRPHTPAPPAVQPTAPDDKGRPTSKEPARQVKEGDFDDSAAGEEDPGAGIDTLVPKPKH